MSKMCTNLTPEEIDDIRQALRKAFDEFDADKSGFIDAKEFENICLKYNELPEGKRKFEPATIKGMAKHFIKVADMDGDGKVNFFEYVCFSLEQLVRKHPELQSKAK